jgi:anti-sigma-K factor RskA
MRHIPPAQARPLETSPHWFGVFWRTVASAGAVAAIALLAVIALQLRNNVADLSTQVAALQTELAQVRSENAQLIQVNDSVRQELARQQTQIAVLTNPDQTIALAGTEIDPDASGDFVRRGDIAMLTLRGLPSLTTDQTYQLWLLSPAGDTIPADLLPVAGPASQTMAIAIAPEHQNLVGVGISIEPAGGSQTPTDIVLLGTNATSA